MKDINQYLKTGYDWMLGLFADLVKDNRKNTDKTVKQIEKSGREVAYEVSGLNDSLSKVVKAINDKEITEKVEITNPEAIGIGIVDKLNEVVDTLKSEIIKIDKNVVIKNDLSSLAALFKGSNDKKDVINALSAISSQIKAHETVDYTLLLDDIATLIESIKIPTVELGKIEKTLSEIREKTIEFPEQTNFLKDYEEKGRIKVILSDKQLARMGGTVALQGGVGNNNATREGQDLIVSAIENITIPAPSGGATEAKQLPDNHQVSVSNFPGSFSVSNFPSTTAVSLKTVALTASGNVHVPTGGKKTRVFNLKFSLSADMTDISFRWASGGTDFIKFLAPKAGGYYGTNIHPEYLEGATDAILYCVITGTGTVQINIEYLEI
jgi:hypothetical protein